MSDDDYIDLNNYPELNDDYIYIEDNKALDNIEFGVYIKYINSDLKLRQGGIYVNRIQNNGTNYLILLQKKFKKFYKINFKKNYIFKKKLRNERMKELFLKYYDKYDDKDS
tara:strand:+ start:5953 stop:6285 length:333 start_codon:yes stop_codon:yes gene_type:complete